MFTISGYPNRGNPIFGKVVNKRGVMTLAKDDKPYTTLGYANGAGWINGVRQNLTSVDTADKDYIQQSTYGTVWLDNYSETHGGEDVGMCGSLLLLLIIIIIIIIIITIIITTTIIIIIIIINVTILANIDKIWLKRLKV